MACDLVAGRLTPPGGIIDADETWVLSHHLDPAPLAGFLILEPRRHVDHIGELPTAEAEALGPALARACGALRRAMAAEKVYVCSFGSLVTHVHFYLIPRMAFMPGDLSGPELLSEVLSGRWACTAEEARAVVGRVRGVMER